jgi:hypothetical protein
MEIRKYTPILCAIAVAALMRLIPHYPNVTPLVGMGLLGTAYIERKWLAFVAPILALFLSDLVLNNIIYASYYDGFQWITSAWIYLALAAVMGVGFISLRQISPTRIIQTSLIASIVFFLITNIWSWQWDPMYAKDLSGLGMAYIAGLPFLGYSIMGDLFYCALLFGGMAWWMQRNKTGAQAVVG